MNDRQKEQEQGAAIFKDLASQHKQMAQSYPAYRAMLERIDAMIAEEDHGWERFTKDEIDVRRGRKAALVDFKRYLKSFLDAKIEA